MKVAIAIVSIFISSAALASQTDIDTCIKAWGAESPFKAGTAPQKTISTGVKVFGIGSKNTGDDQVTKEPQLVEVKPAVNVLGKSKIVLGNPNGWYCFVSNVSVLGKIDIEADCKAHIASGKDGANVLGASDTNQGVTVLGSLRVTRIGCPGAAQPTKN